MGIMVLLLILGNAGFISSTVGMINFVGWVMSSSPIAKNLQELHGKV